MLLSERYLFSNYLRKFGSVNNEPYLNLPPLPRPKIPDFPRRYLRTLDPLETTRALYKKRSDITVYIQTSSLPLFLSAFPPTHTPPPSQWNHVRRSFGPVCSWPYPAGAALSLSLSLSLARSVWTHRRRVT